MANRIQAACWITTLAILLVGLECRLGMADPVSVNPLQLTPQSSNANPEPFTGNWFSTFEHSSGLIRAEVDAFPHPSAPYGGLLKGTGSLDVNHESWFIADQGDYFPGAGGFTEIPYITIQNPPAPAVIPSEVFYVAFVWDYNFFGGSGNEIYGWAKLQAAAPLPPSPGNPLGSFNPDLILLASATTTDDRGIVVGEYRVVPEPASAACASIALIGLLLTARNGVACRKFIADGEAILAFPVTVRIDTPVELDYYRNGGILHTVTRKLLKG
jgi:hypothetical protein